MRWSKLNNGVGEELMRDSALKRKVDVASRRPALSRRRAHARQRFETLQSFGGVRGHRVGEELMRDSALKPPSTSRQQRGLLFRRRRAHARQRFETVYLLPHLGAVFDGRRRAHARQRFETYGNGAGQVIDHESEKSSCATAL